MRKRFRKILTIEYNSTNGSFLNHFFKIEIIDIIKKRLNKFQP